MPHLTGIVRVEDADGNRVDQPDANGVFSPIVLQVDSTMTAEATPNGATTRVRLSAPGAGGGGVVSFADHAAFRALADGAISDGQVINFKSPVGTFIYLSGEGAGQPDDDRSILKRTATSLGSNARAYSADAPTVPTYATLRLAVSGKNPHVQVQGRSSIGDSGGGLFVYDPADTTTADNDGTVIVAGTRRYKRVYAGALHAEWWGLTGSAAVVHDGNGTDVARATANKTALLNAYAVAQAMGGREILAPVGNFPITVGPTCFKVTGYTGITLRGQGKNTIFFDPQVTAVTPETSFGGAFFWFLSCTKVYVKNMRLIGSADYAAQIPTNLIRTDRKGVYFQTLSNETSDCGWEDFWCETVEGEVYFGDGVPSRLTGRNLHTLNCTANAWNVSGVDCGVDGIECENLGQSILQMQGTRVYARNIRGYQTNGLQTTADVFLLAGSDTDPSFVVEDFTLSNYDIRRAGVGSDVIVIGFSNSPHKGTLRNGKLNNCKINTDSANTNGMIRVFAGEQFFPGNHVKIKGLDIRNIEMNECGGSPGVGSKVTAISFTGGAPAGDDVAVTVTDLRIHNGAAGNLNRAIHIHNDVSALNRIQINPVSHDIQGVGAEPYKFEVAPWKDYASTRRITGLTTDEKLASLIAQLNLNQVLVEDVGFQPPDFTSATGRAWYDASYGIQLGDTPRLTGTSPAITIAVGSDLQQPIGLFIKVTTGGARGTAKFDWSKDNGATWVATGVFTAASVSLEQVGIVLNFATGTYVLNDTYEGTVEKWFDKVGLVNGPLFLVQSTPAKQFLYKVAGGPNGRPHLSAGGVDCYMSISYTRPEPSYIYVVAKAEVAFSADGETLVDGLNGNTFRCYRTSSTAWKMTEVGLTTVTLASVTPLVDHDLELYFNGAASEGLEDGASKGTGDVGTGTTALGLSIGAFSGGASGFLHASYSEIIELNAKPSGIEQGAMRASLAAKYGL